jgi:hypothetical protein
MFVLAFLSCQKKKIDEPIETSEVPMMEVQPAYTSYDVQGWDTEIIGTDKDALFYIDRYSSTWSYSFNIKDLPTNKALRISGTFPDAIYMSYYLFDKKSFTTLGSIYDVNIQPDEGVHPIEPTEAEYTIWVVREENGIEEKANKLLIPDGVGEVAVVLRYFLTSGDEYGMVDIPRITTEDIVTYETVSNPPSSKKNKDESVITAELVKRRAKVLFSDFNLGDELYSYRFGSFHSSLGSHDNEYLMMPMVLEEDEVALIRFVPPTAADSIYDEDADMRYWSVGFGDDDTHTILTLRRDDLVVSNAGFVYIAISDSDMSDVLSVEKGWNFVDWPDNKNLVVVYRNVLTSPNAPFNIEDVGLVNFTKDVKRQSADKAIGDFAPVGIRIKKSEAEEWAKHYEYGE